jgi:AraC-like DNA-binding protein
MSAATLSAARSPGDHAGAGLPPPAGPHPAPGTLFLTPPPDDLAPLVEYLWQLELPGGAPPDAFWRVVVDGYVDVAVRIPVESPLLRAAARAAERGDACREVVEALAASPTVVCGAAEAARVIPLGGPMLLTGVRFRLGHASRVLRSSADALADGARPLRDVLVGPGAATAARPLAAHGATACTDAREAAREAVRTVAARASDATDESALGDDAAAALALRRFARAGVLALARRLVARGIAREGHAAAIGRVRHALALFDHAAAGALAPPAELEADAAARVSAVARTLTVSPRTLERLFAEHVGYAPRTYLRLRRVGAVAEALEQDRAADAAPADGTPAEGTLAAAPRLAPPAPTRAAVRRPATLSELAHRVGYSDHAHMTREFTRVMGTPPSVYRRDVRDAPLVRRFAPVAFERTVPWGGVGRARALATG